MARVSNRGVSSVPWQHGLVHQGITISVCVIICIYMFKKGYTTPKYPMSPKMELNWFGYFYVCSLCVCAHAHSIQNNVYIYIAICVNNYIYIHYIHYIHMFPYAFEVLFVASTCCSHGFCWPSMLAALRTLRTSALLGTPRGSGIPSIILMGNPFL